MAEALASAGAGHNLTRATFLEYCTKHSEIERELAECAETRRSLNRRRKDLRKNMAAAGIDIDQFERHLIEIELTPEERDANARKLAQMIEWRTLPPGFQASMQYDDEHPIERALSFLELQKIDDDGFAAGRAGRRSDSNPHKPGSEEFLHWHNAWHRGQSVSVGEMGAGAPTAGGTNGAAGGYANGQRRGGPPKGSKNRATLEREAAERAAAHLGDGTDARSELPETGADPEAAPPSPGE